MKWGRVMEWFKGWCPKATLAAERRIMRPEGFLRYLPRRTWLTAVSLVGLTLVVSSAMIAQAMIPKGAFLDDLTVHVGEKLVLSERFSSRNMADTGWQGISGAVQEKYVYSSPYALNVGQEGRAETTFHSIQIGEEWKIVNYTAYIMASPKQGSEYVTNRDRTLNLKPSPATATYSPWIGLRLHSGSSQSSITMAVLFQYFEYYYPHLRTELWLCIENNDTTSSNKIAQDAYDTRIDLEPFHWYEISLVVDRASEEAYVYLDQKSVLRLRLLDTGLFKTFHKISVEVLSDTTLPR